MPRIRYIKPEFFTDENIAELPMEARLLFQGMWCLADRAGRLEDRPKYIKAMLFPYDNVDVDKMLALLDGSGKRFIQRYQVDGRAFIQITHFDKHQKPHHTEKPSEIPQPPIETGDTGTLTVKPPCKDVKPPDLMGKGMGMEKGMGNGESPKPAAPEAPKQAKEFSAEAVQLTDKLMAMMRTNDPKAKLPHDPAKWREEADRLIRIDGRSFVEVQDVLEWCQHDNFWRGNILSMPKFREKYPQLKLQMERQNGSGTCQPGSYAKPVPGKYAHLGKD